MVLPRRGSQERVLSGAWWLAAVGSAGAIVGGRASLPGPIQGLPVPQGWRVQRRGEQTFGGSSARDRGRLLESEKACQPIGDGCALAKDSETPASKAVAAAP